METPRPNSHLNWHRGVRVIGKIRPFLESEASPAADCESSSSSRRPQISMSRIDGEFASISLGDQINGRKDDYKLDWCYGQDEGISEVYAKEIKPLIQGIITGCNGCFIAYGAKGSGKTQLLQGCEESPGLAVMAMSEIMPLVKELGGSVSISCYEVCHDRVYDILEPKEQEVHVMEDAARTIQLRGLSQIPVELISEFKKYYFYGCNERKMSQRATNEVVNRCHKGLIIHISYLDKESNNSHVQKMNFIDLAGYEDIKSKNFAKSDLAEIAKVNKSLYSLLNVVCALNSNETYIPYRETKLTHLLQDFLCRTSAAVLFTCLNPIPCQDTIRATCLASRSCMVVNKYRHGSAKYKKSCPRTALLCSPSPINRKTGTLNASVKKHEISKLCSVEKNRTASSAKRNIPQSLSNIRKQSGNSLFNSAEKTINEVASEANKGTMFMPKSPTINTGKVLVEDENILLKAKDTESPIPKEDVFATNEQNNLQTEIDSSLTDLKLDNDGLDVSKYVPGQTPFSDVGEPSPTLTEKLREISNSLRLASSRPIIVSTPLDEKSKEQVHMNSIEPKTPGNLFQLRLDSRFEEMCNPQDLSKACSTRLKETMVQECLAFLNTADKEELKELKGIGEKRASYIMELREQNPNPFKDINDLHDLGLSKKQIKGMMSGLFGNI